MRPRRPGASRKQAGRNKAGTQDTEGTVRKGMSRSEAGEMAQRMKCLPRQCEGTRAPM